jgi:hypothetical protein
MNSSNSSDKRLSGNQDETTGPNTTDATALTRPTDTPTPHVRADRTHGERTSSPTDRSALVRALTGLLHALVHDDTEPSTSTTADGTTVDESTEYTERTASKGEYGSRTEPVDGVYGHTTHGDPVVAPTGRLAASRIDANWTPGDTLYDPDRAGDVAAPVVPLLSSVGPPRICRRSRDLACRDSCSWISVIASSCPSLSSTPGPRGSCGHRDHPWIRLQTQCGP